MRDFMQYLEHAFYTSSHWDENNNYASITATAQALLNFPIPQGLHLTVSSFPSPQSASSYTLGSVGLVNGSLSYLYSSLPLPPPAHSRTIPLRDVVLGYRHVPELKPPNGSWSRRMLDSARRGRKDTLLYGRLYLPRSSLEALYVRRLSIARQLRISCVSDGGLRNGASVLVGLSQDVGKWSMDYLCSTDSALLGVRGLYNFGLDPRHATTQGTSELAQGQREIQQHQYPQYGRFSAGFEMYYGILNKSGGMSTGLRFTTLPRHTGFPYTMTLTLNPLMGNVSSTYAVKAGRDLALCSQFDFNFYSYESDLKLGLELWRRKRPMEDDLDDLDWAERMIRPEWRVYEQQRPAVIPAPALAPVIPVSPAVAKGSGSAEEYLVPADDVLGVVKARWDQNWRVGVLWEGRIKELLFSMGVSVDLRRREQIFTAVGAELQYSS